MSASGLASLPAWSLSASEISVMFDLSAWSERNASRCRGWLSRVFHARRQRIAVILLCGGDKSSQAKDIVRAQRMAQAIE
jgi:hypothetical protein